jgi:hypothetical protein
MKVLRVLMFIPVLFFGCEEGPTRSSDYLPLQVGNYWRLKSINHPNSNTYYFKKVNAKVTLEGHSYFEVISGYADPDEVNSDTVYYRIEVNGFVYTRRKRDDLEENKFRLNGRDGETWTYKYVNNAEVSIELSEVSLELGTETLRNCKAYFYDVDQMADEEYTYTLARGIGFVKEYSNGWGSGSLLKSAQIDGRIINF